MRSLFFFFLFLFLSFTRLAARDRQPADTTLEKALLWRISGNGITAASYLYGTIHFVPANDVDTPAVLRNALYHTDALYLEIVDTASGFLPDNKNIREFLGKRYFKQIKKAVEKVYA